MTFDMNMTHDSGVEDGIDNAHDLMTYDMEVYNSEMDDMKTCRFNEVQRDGECVKCAPGEYVDRFGEEECLSIQCGENEHVNGHACIDCPMGETNGSRDLASGEDTDCVRVHQIATANNFFCAFVEGDEVLCAGVYYGKGREDIDLTENFQAVSGIEKITGIFANLDHACAIANEGEVWCWGKNRYGINGYSSPEEIRTPVRVSEVSTVIDIKIFNSMTCLMDEDRNATCWGYVGRGEPVPPTLLPLPAKVQKLMQGIERPIGQEVSEKIYTQCALLVDGTVSCFVDPSKPETFEKIPSLENTIDLANGVYQSCALREDGTIDCWRHIEFTELDGTKLPANEFVRVQGISSAAISLYGFPGLVNQQEDVCALTLDGAVYCWEVRKLEATQVDFGQKVVSLNGNNSGGMCALLESGSVKCVGLVQVGQTTSPSRFVSF